MDNYVEITIEKLLDDMGGSWEGKTAIDFLKLHIDKKKIGFYVFMKEYMRQLKYKKETPDCDADYETLQFVEFVADYYRNEEEM